ncbi:roundabout homolog 2-like isoform X2, partial [Arapaima gigas]
MLLPRFVFLFGLLHILASGSRLRQEDSPPRIVEHPSDLIVSKGEPATLNCKAEGRPLPSVEWYKDGERVETDRDNPRSHRMLLPSGSLFFLRIVHGRRSKPDDGSYVCVARNYLGEAVSRNASLEVALLRDDFRQNPTDVVVAAGETAMLECQPPRGHPEPTTYWKKDKVRLEDKDDRVTIRGGKLTITGTRRSDAGMYTCVAVNMVGERDSEAAQLSVFERPSFLRRPTNQVVLVEESVELRCQVQGDPLPTVRWRKDDADLPRGRYEVKHERDEHVLRVRKASTMDQGRFACVAENRVGKAEAEATLTVRAAPQFVVRPRDQIVAQGRTATFPCETKGNPQPAVFWQKEGTQNLLFPSMPQQLDSRFSVSPSGELTVSSVQRSDAGYYICQALTVAGSIMAKAQLEVTDAMTDRPPPIIRQGPANQTLSVGESALLRCQASGDPPPAVSWLKDGTSLPARDPRLSLVDVGSLQIHNTKLSDSGIYTCVAGSSTGETTWSAFLEVRAAASVPHDASDLPGPPSKPQITDVTRNSVSLSWQPGSAGASPITSYVIEAFSQLVSNSWQTAAEHVKNTQFTVRGLRPNTIYLFIVRAVNSQGLGDPSPVSEPVRTQDLTPTAQGVDHREVQKELGEVVVHLHDPQVLSPTAIQVTWTVDNPTRFIQGYRVMYRQTSGLPAPGTWRGQDVTPASERRTVLSGLRKGVVYEVKARPYFNDFQGVDSESKTGRTAEEAPSAPPQQVTVLSLGSYNSTSISVSWDPPPLDHQNGIIQEYKIWCLANETRFHVNKTVDAAIRLVVVGGLLAGVQYRVEVAASTSAGVGVRSEPRPILIGKDLKDVITGGDEKNSISDVVKQPAFIAGIGGACWIVLMGFSTWLYWRRKKRKGLSNYAVTFQRGDRGLMSNTSRPGLLKAGDPGFPWLADSWPTSSLPISGGSGGPSDTGNFGRGDLLPAGQGEKTGTMLSEGAIYSSIDFSSKPGYGSQAAAFGGQATPYATTQILQSSSFHQLAVELPEPRWKAAAVQGRPEGSSVGYALGDPHSCNSTLLFIPDTRLADGLSSRIPHNQSQDFSSGSSHNSSERTLSGGKGAKKKKAKSGSKTPKSNGSCWANVPLPPPPMQPLPGTEVDHYGPGQEGGGYKADSLRGTLPPQSYLHQGMEDELEEERVPTPPIRGVASSPAPAALSPTPSEEMHSALQAHLDELTRAYQLDVARHAWQLQASQTPPQAPAPPVGYVSSTLLSDPDNDIPDDEEEEESDYELSRRLCGLQHTDNLDVCVTGECHSQCPQAGSPLSADGGVMGSHSLSHPGAPQHGWRQRGGRAESGGTEPQRRDAFVAGETPARGRDPTGTRRSDPRPGLRVVRLVCNPSSRGSQRRPCSPTARPASRVPAALRLEAFSTATGWKRQERVSAGPTDSLSAA